MRARTHQYGLNASSGVRKHAPYELFGIKILAKRQEFHRKTGKIRYI